MTSLNEREFHARTICRGVKHRPPASAAFPALNTSKRVRPTPTHGLRKQRLRRACQHTLCCRVFRDPCPSFRSHERTISLENFPANGHQWTKNSIPSPSCPAIAQMAGEHSLQSLYVIRYRNHICFVVILHKIVNGFRIVLQCMGDKKFYIHSGTTVPSFKPYVRCSRHFADNVHGQNR